MDLDKFDFDGDSKDDLFRSDMEIADIQSQFKLQSATDELLDLTKSGLNVVDNLINKAEETAVEDQVIVNDVISVA